LFATQEDSYAQVFCSTILHTSNLIPNYYTKNIPTKYCLRNSAQKTFPSPITPWKKNPKRETVDNAQSPLGP